MYQVIKEKTVLAEFKVKAEAFAFAKETSGCIVQRAKQAVEDVSVQFAEDCQASLQNTFDKLLEWLKATYIKKESIYPQSARIRKRRN